jgi:hypothetical protein
VALLVAIAFWTWLWGPIGLILATPLTVCLVVLSKYVPQFGFIPLLMGDAPVGTPDVRFYQRLLADDEDEAMEIAQEVEDATGDDELPDALVRPTLVALRRDTREGVLAEEDAERVLRALENVLEALFAPSADAPPAREPAVILGYPVGDRTDRVALVALAALTRRTERCVLDVMAPGLLVSELVDRVLAEAPALVCLGSVGPGGVARAVLAVKRLRAQCPGVRVVVGRYGGSPEGVERLLAAGAQRVCTTLAATRNELHDLSRLEPLPPRAAEAPLRPSAAG